MGYSKEQTIVLGAVFTALPILVVALRFWARRITGAGYRMDDYLIVPALLFAVGLGTALIIGACIGQFGQHQKQVFGPDGKLIHDPDLKKYEKIKFSIQLMSVTLLGFSKLSLVFLYRRIFSSPTFRKVVDVFIGILIAWLIAFELATLFQCTPISTIWTRFEYEYGPYCIQVVPYYYTISVTDTLTDVIIMILPLPIIWNLHMPLKQRLAVAGMFLLGAIVIGASLARLIVFIQVGQELQTQFHNITYHTTPVFSWSIVEASLSVISACLPTLRPIFMRQTSRARTPYWTPSRSSERSKGFKPADRLGDEETELDSKHSLVGGPKGKNGSMQLNGNHVEVVPVQPEGVKPNDVQGIWIQRGIRQETETK
jgi:hypothetical protein